MIIFINNKSTKFCQITLRIKRFIHKRKVVPFFLPHGVVRTIRRTVIFFSTTIRMQSQNYYMNFDSSRF